MCVYSNRTRGWFSQVKKILPVDKFIHHQEGIFAYKVINGTYLPNDILTDRYDLIFLIRWFLTATSGTKPIIVSAWHVYILLHQREKWGSTIQYGYNKRGTHTRVFSQTLTHGNSKNEIRQWDRRRRTEERREYGKKSTAGNPWNHGLFPIFSLQLPNSCP